MASNSEILTCETNEYEKYRKPIKDIIDFANTIEQRYQEKCFEVLLNRYLVTSEKKNGSTSEEGKNFVGKPDFPNSLTSFLQENEITEENLNKLFARTNGQVQPIYKIYEKRKAVAQIQLALLMALENALISPTGAFEFSIKAVRQKCSDADFYDGIDFISNFKNKAGLFHNLDAEIIRLTPIGKAELANVVRIVTRQLSQMKIS